MFPSSRARSGTRRRSRLLAACTTGVLAAGAIALGPAAAHADSAPPQAGFRAKAPATPGPTLALPRPARARSATAAAGALTAPRYDIDGDGYQDFLTQEIDGTIHQLSSKAGAWSTLGRTSTVYRDLLTPGDLTTALAGPELLTLTATGRLSLWDHTAFPHGTPAWTGGGWQGYSAVVTVGDIDGNGFGDLLARTPGGVLYLYKGTGDVDAPFAGRVQVGSDFGYGSGYGLGYDQLIGAGDLTGTGHETLVARDLDGRLWMYTLDGTQAAPLSDRVEIGTGWNVYNQLIGIGDETGRAGGLFGRAQNGDLYSYQGTVTGTGTGTLTARAKVSTGWNSQVVAGQGALPVWGKNDLYAQTPGGDLYYYYGTLTGGLSARARVGDAGGFQGNRLLTSVSLSAQDEEPLLELFNGVLYNDTKGFDTVHSGGWGGYDAVFGPGDLSGDGTSDLLARDTAGVLWLLPGRGDGSFLGRIRVGGGWGPYTALTGAGDIDGDGLVDIVARTSSGHLYLYRGTGRSAAPFAARVDIGAGWNTYTRLASPGDLDGDGRADLVGVTSGGLLYRYSGSGRGGTGTFKPRVEIGAAGWNSYSALF